MSKIKITCDSTCDLTNELYNNNNVTVVPLSIALGDEIRRDSIDIDADEIFRYVKATNQLPKTSAISIGEYEDVFGKLVNEGYTVIHINLSSELSSSHQNACLAAEDIGNVYVVDSRNLSSGSGHLVLLAAALAESGMEAGEIVEILNEKKSKLDVSFVLQTLEYLHKGGRCSGVAAFGANALRLHPEIQVCDGKMQVGRKYRGDMEKSILAYVHGRLDNRDDIDTDRIFVTHSGVPEELLNKVVATVKELHPFKEVLITRAGCTISSHCGPACIGVLFFRK